LGKAVVTQTADGGILLDIDGMPSTLRLTTQAATVNARIAGADGRVARDANGDWIVSSPQESVP
jgi:hypothetical protein